MTSELRVVFDTNVTVSAVLLPRSVPRQAVDAAFAHGRVLISAATIFELEQVLRRAKFDKYIAETHRLEFLATLVNEAVIVDVIDEINACRDPKDNKFLDLAVAGRATHLITGDDDLLSLQPFRSIAILTPQAFLHSME